MTLADSKFCFKMVCMIWFNCLVMAVNGQKCSDIVLYLVVVICNYHEMSINKSLNGLTKYENTKILRV